MPHRPFLAVYLAVLLALAFLALAIPQPQLHVHSQPRFSQLASIFANMSSSMLTTNKNTITSSLLTTLTPIFPYFNPIMMMIAMINSFRSPLDSFSTSSRAPSSTPSSPAPCADPSTSGSEDDDINVPDIEFYQNFTPYDALYEKWDRLARLYAPIVQVSTIGTSYEGRPIRLLLLDAHTYRSHDADTSSNKQTARKRRGPQDGSNFDNPTTNIPESSNVEKSSDLPVVFLNAALHAREWITPMAATYVVEKLAARVQRERTKTRRPSHRPVTSPADLKSTENDQPDLNAQSDQVREDSLVDLLSRVRVIVAPLSNPDGYIYSWESHLDWRKNRRPDGGCHDPRQDGVDLNRNWAKFYNGSHSTSVNPCNDLFIGTGAFSEPETSALRNLILQHRVVAHLDVHSFGQFVLGPWSASDNEPPTASAIDSVGTGLAAAMSAPHGARYMFARGASGASKLGQYAASGVMSDWLYSEGIMSFTIELRPEDNGRDPDAGFRPPPHMILAASAELFAATRCLLAYADNPTTFGCRLNCSSSRGRQIPPAIPIYAVALISVAVVIALVAVVSIASLAVMARIRARRRRAALIRAFAGDGSFQIPPPANVVTIGRASANGLKKQPTAETTKDDLGTSGSAEYDDVEDNIDHSLAKDIVGSENESDDGNKDVVRKDVVRHGEG